MLKSAKNCLKVPKSATFWPNPKMGIAEVNLFYLNYIQKKVVRHLPERAGHQIINIQNCALIARPGVAGVFYKHLCYSLIHSFIKSETLFLPIFKT